MDLSPLIHLVSSFIRDRLASLSTVQIQEARNGEQYLKCGIVVDVPSLKWLSHSFKSGFAYQ